ncbi:hypothetical protein GCM10007207_00120 [Asaia siamensis]|uniref:Methyl-accepting chemotaxis protein n=2 Tax=Asaia siamensis TaxID=110479 RepID=A0ABQ1L985_9PROT|nr:hypothetical protein GCM10007207_00120 [Asaia siamensis]
MKTWLYQEASYRSKISTTMLCIQLLLVVQLICAFGFFYDNAFSSGAFYTLLALTLILLASSLFFRLALIQAVAEPVETILTYGEGLIRGDARGRTRFSDTRDESGRLIALLSRLHEARSDKSEDKAQIEALSKEVDGLKSGAAAKVAEIKAAVATIETAMSAVAKGNLDQTITGDILNGDLAKIAISFNEACQNWRTVLINMARSSEFITTGAAEISMASDDLARRTEIQAENLGKAASSVRTISEGIKATADVCSESSVDTKKTLDQVKLATEVMDEANTAMSGIQKSSSAIGEIISVIDGITFQTNVLALNAGVEAARAGDAGRGFAVVAQEVRSLAEKSAKSANEIKRLISVSAEQVDKGVGLVHRTSQYLGDFSESISSIAHRIEDLTKTTREQALRLAEVTSSINDMDQVTQQNAAMVEEATAASHNLTTETRSLTQTLNGFGLGKKAEAAPMARKPAAPPAKPVVRQPQPTRAATASTQALETKSPTPVRPAPKAPAKPALQVTSSDQGWEDF